MLEILIGKNFLAESFAGKTPSHRVQYPCQFACHGPQQSIKAQFTKIKRLENAILALSNKVAKKMPMLKMTDHFYAAPLQDEMNVVELQSQAQDKALGIPVVVVSQVQLYAPFFYLPNITNTQVLWHLQACASL
jgi:hypothetical protein